MLCTGAFQLKRKTWRLTGVRDEAEADLALHSRDEFELLCDDAELLCDDDELLCVSTPESEW